jgi:hypothetical protein
MKLKTALLVITRGVIVNVKAEQRQRALLIIAELLLLVITRGVIVNVKAEQRKRALLIIAEFLLQARNTGDKVLRAGFLRRPLQIPHFLRINVMI